MTTRAPRKTAAQMRAEAPQQQQDVKQAQRAAAERAAADSYLKGTSIEKLLTGLSSLSVEVGETLAGTGEKIPCRGWPGRLRGAVRT